MARGDSVQWELSPVGESALADAIREKIGAAPTDVVKVVTPQFTRPPGEPVPACPSADQAWWQALRTMGYCALREMGMGLWGVKQGKALLLFPDEWYRSIPDGFSVVSIGAFDFGASEPEVFVKNETDNDIRFGHLAYGIVVDCELSDDE